MIDSLKKDSDLKSEDIKSNNNTLSYLEKMTNIADSVVPGVGAITRMGIEYYLK